MKKNIGIGIVLVAIISSLLMVMPVQAELATEMWGLTYDSGGYDEFLAVAVDSNDNVIVIGEFSGTAYTIKLNSSGNEIWNVTFDGNMDNGRGVAVDSNNNIIVTGCSFDGIYRYYTIKYDSDGNELWNATYYSGAGGWDYAMGVAIDSNDNVIVVGAVTAGAKQAATVKYNSSGSELWNVTYNSWKHRGVAVDSNDNVLVVGKPTGVDSYLIKYDSGGNELWVDTSVGQETIYSVATDSLNNVIINGGSPAPPDYYTAKYDSSGNELWSVTYDSGGNDYPGLQAAAVDSMDNIIVTGSAYFDASGNNCYTIKYDSNGNEIWNVAYDSGGDDGGSAVAVDSSDNVVVVGYIENSDYDAHIIKYRNFNPPHGIYGWVYRLPSSTFANDTYIACSNSTYSDSFTTNETGYYLFDNLSAGNYWVNATKYGYDPNSALVEIAEEYNKISVDNCDVISNNGNWESNGTVTADTTNKKEGVASINVTTNSSHIFWKNFTTPIDASSISKNTGFLAFWYYVDNTTRLGDYSTITIGNGTYKSSNNISWVVSNSYYGNGWGEIYLPLNEGTETGTLDMSAISWFDMNVSVSDNVTHKIDYLRFVEYPYTLHNIYLEPESEAGVGTYYPPPHLVEFRVVDVWGVPLSDITINATGYETTVGDLTWWQNLFGFSAEVEVYNSTMEGTTDSAGHISFFMVETIKYKMYFTNASQNISAYREIYPKDDRYTITIGEVPAQKIAYWITTEQNNTANTGNITLHYSDYNSPVKTNWVNFSIYYLDNNTLAYTHNFTTINETNENTSIDLNATYSYKVKCVADHDDFGVFTWYVTVIFILPEKPKLPVVQTLKDSLEGWQLQTFSMFVIILFALIFGAYSSGVGGMVVSFMAIGFHLFGMMPLVPVLAGVVIYPLIAVMAIVNLLGEQRAGVVGG